MIMLKREQPSLLQCFRTYDELGDKARKSAVSHFIEEMHRAEETLPPPSLRYTLAEQMNNKLIDYYEEENNPNTNGYSRRLH